MEWRQKIESAIVFIGTVTGYKETERELAALWTAGRIRVAATMADRGRASLSGVITLGPEALNGTVIGLAETLIHENYHRHQNPFLKTTSFWRGVATGTHPLRRYERPAYGAALAFLQAVEISLPERAEEARQERIQLLTAFERHYGASLIETEP